MFFFAFLFFAGFALFYLILSLATIYHLWRFAFPEHPAPVSITAGFLVLSGILWFLAAGLLLQIPS